MPGRDRADCSGEAPRPLRASEAMLPKSRVDQEGSLRKSAQRGSRAEEGRGPPPGRSRATGPCTRTEKREGRQGFQNGQLAGGRTPADFSGQTDLRRPRSRDPKPALKRKQATCSPENRTRNSPRVLSPLSGNQLGIRLLWPGYGGVTQQVRPRRNLPGCAPISRTPGPAKSAATPRSATPLGLLATPQPFSQFPYATWAASGPGLALAWPFGLGRFLCVSFLISKMG